MGVLWSFAHPLFMLGIYTFVFEHIFQSKWGGAGREVDASFAVILFSGLIIHMFFSEVLSRSASLILSNVNYVKKVVFPLEILCWSVVLSSLVQFLCGLGILFMFLLLGGIAIPASVLLIPLILIPMVLMLIGISYLLSSLTVFIRDLEQIVQVLVTVLLFTSTVFFPLDRVPAFIAPLIKLNPITIPVEAMRSLTFGISPLNYSDLLFYSLFSIVFAIFGFRVFSNLKKSFPDVM